MNIEIFKKLVKLNDKKIMEKRASLIKTREDIDILKKNIEQINADISYANDPSNYNIANLLKGYTLFKENKIQETRLQIEKLEIQEGSIIDEILELFTEKKKIQIYISMEVEKTKQKKIQLKNRN